MGSSKMNCHPPQTSHGHGLGLFCVRMLSLALLCPSAEDWGCAPHWLPFCFHGTRVPRMRTKRSSQQVEEARPRLGHSPGQEGHGVCAGEEGVL